MIDTQTIEVPFLLECLHKPTDILEFYYERCSRKYTKSI